MNFFKNAALHNPDFVKLEKYVNGKNKLPALVTGVSHIHKAHFIAGLLSDVPTLVIAESEGEAQKLCLDINMLLGEQAALLYPEKEFILADAEAASREYEHKRIFALNALFNNSCKAVICSAGAAAQLTIPPEELKKRLITITSEDELSLEELTAQFIAAGYSRADMIEGAGQFSVRGGIIDVFPPSAANPFRIELWGDTVDSLSEFDVESQRRTSSLENISISPARETLFGSGEALCGKIEALAKKLRGKKADAVRANLQNDVNRVRGGAGVRNADRYFPLCYESEATVFDYVDRVFVCENASVRESFRAATLQHSEDLNILVDEAKLCKGLERFMLTKNELYSVIENRTRVYFDSFLRGGGVELGAMIAVKSAIQNSPWGGEYKILEDEMRGLLEKKMCCFIFAGTEKGAVNLARDLADDGFNAEFYANPSEPIPVPGIGSLGFA
ncbi:MAG: hypothetical protein K2J77_05945 [Oscillospiraceae bacterium]|nr:hypothetical protein [Oscillospiraceae bacterium]